MTRLLAAGPVLLALAGCGGSEAQFTRESVEQSMTELHRAELKPGTTMDPLECIMDDDQYHWKCLAYVRQGDVLYKLSTDVTCDKESGECLSEPQALVRT